MEETKIKDRAIVNHSIKIKRDKCKGCQLCIFYCPVGHLSISSRLNKRGVKFAEAKGENRCMACGFCFLICPDSCIEVYESKVKSKK